MVRGNHDDVNSKELTKLAFGDAVKFMEDGFEINGVWIEHGNIIDPYSNPPRRPNEPKKMGFAYFESRASADSNGWQCTRKDPQGRPVTAMDEKTIGLTKGSQPWFNMLSRLTAQLDPKATQKYMKYVSADNYLNKFLNPLMKYSMPANLKDKDWNDIPVTGFNPKTQTIAFSDGSHNYTLANAIADHAHDWELGVEQMG